MVEDEYFWATELSSSKNKEHEWSAVKEEPRDDEDVLQIPRHSLIIKQAVLSLDAPDNDEVVIEAETEGYMNVPVKAYIAVMQKGKEHQRHLDLVFHDKVTLRLVKGTGPVHLVGTHGVSYRYVEDDDDGLEEEEEMEEEEMPKPAPKRKKPDDVPPPAAPAAKAKRGGKK